jgi:hypothetical protein
MTPGVAVAGYNGASCSPVDWLLATKLPKGSHTTHTIRPSIDVIFSYSSSESDSSLDSAVGVGACSTGWASPGSWPGLYRSRRPRSCAMRSSCSRALMGLFFLGFADVDDDLECLGGAARDTSGEDGTLESLPNPGSTFLHSSHSLSNASLLSWSISSSSSPSVFS